MIRKQNQSNREIKQNERREKKENLIDEDVDLGKVFELATSNKIYVNNLNLHEIENEILQEHRGDFELNGLLIIGPVEHKTNVRLKNMDDFERYIIAIDVDNDGEDVTFTGYVYKLNTPQFNVARRSAYGKSTDFMQEIVDYRGQNCYIPTSGMCFIKCTKCFTKKNNTELFLAFIPSKQRRYNVMKSARIERFCIKYNINIGCFDATRNNPRNVTQRNTSLFI